MNKDSIGTTKVKTVFIGIPNWAGDRDAALELTLVTPLLAQTLPQAGITPGNALTHAYERTN